jgi:CAAX protease family protein
MKKDESETGRRRVGMSVFFLIAFGVPWTCWLVLRRSMPVDQLFDSFTTTWFTAAPSVAGFVAAYVEDGWRGLSEFCRCVFNLQFKIYVWVLALGLPLIAALLTFATHPVDLMQGEAPNWARLIGTASLMNFFTGPLAEEFGWRGYFLQRLSRRFNPVAAGLIIALIWATWHLPIFYDTVFAHLTSTLGYLGWVVAWSVVLALIVAKARGSVLPSILGHWAINASAGVFFALLPAIPGERQPGGLAMTVSSLVVAMVFAASLRYLARFTKTPLSGPVESTHAPNKSPSTIVDGRPPICR